VVNLEWYRSFVEVYRVGTVSGAAQVLHLTQPAVSQHVAALEAVLGTPLFQRMPRRMLPTEAGKRLYTRVIVAIEALETVPTRTTFTDTIPIIRLGTPPEFFAERVLGLIAQSETINLSTQFGMTQTLIEQLLENHLDCVIATQKISNSELEYQPIFKENFWLIAPPNLTIPFNQDFLQSDLSQLEQWLLQQPWIAYGEDLPIIRRFWRVVFGRRLEVSPQFVIPDLRSIRGAIAQGLGLSVLPDYLCEPMVKTKELTLVLQPTNAVTNQIWLAYRKAERQSQQVKGMVNLFDSLR
jgi:DNA-binding transcriptional LysR family regulator